jgi:4-carboxymuconolactone decarboxylase
VLGLVVLSGPLRELLPIPRPPLGSRSLPRRWTEELVRLCCATAGGPRHQRSMTNTTDRFQRGLEILKQIGGADYDAPLNKLRDLAPDLARFTVEFAYGDVLARPGLGLEARQLCTVAALAGLGNALPQLRYHVNGAFNVGCRPAEVLEVTILAAVYAGFPAALNGISAVREVLQQRGGVPEGAVAAQAAPAAGEERYQRGLRVLEQVSGRSGAAVLESLKDLAPDLARFIVEFSYGDVIGRSGLDLKTKELATVALLTALGTAQPQLKVHVAAALNVGSSRGELVEVIQQMAVYAGFPAALNGLAAAREIFEKRG